MTMRTAIPVLINVIFELAICTCPLEKAALPSSNIEFKGNPFADSDQLALQV